VRKNPIGHCSINMQTYKTCKYGVPGRIPRKIRSGSHPEITTFTTNSCQESLINAPSPETWNLKTQSIQHNLFGTGVTCQQHVPNVKEAGAYENREPCMVYIIDTTRMTGISISFTWISHWFLPTNQSSDKFFKARQGGTPLAVITPQCHEALPVIVTSRRNMITRMGPHTCKDVLPSLSPLTISSSSLEVWSIALCFKNKLSISSFLHGGISPRIDSHWARKNPYHFDRAREAPHSSSTSSS
jgi:hypothetical protein